MYEAAFKNIDDTLRKDAGCSSELDYVEQTSWILFLKYLDDFETEKETAAILNGEAYSRILDGEYRWQEWAAPRKADGSFDYNTAMTGDDLRNFVNQKLFPTSPASNKPPRILEPLTTRSVRSSASSATRYKTAMPYETS